MKVKKRILRRVKLLDNDCWEWQGSSDCWGYGHVNVEGENCRVHRVLWEILVGPLTPGLTLDHLCRNTLCCNPDHLEEVTVRENVLRGNGPTAKNARKTHCKHGHEFTEENTYQSKHPTYGTVLRKCVQCTKKAADSYYYQNKELCIKKATDRYYRNKEL